MAIQGTSHQEHVALSSNVTPALCIVVLTVPLGHWDSGCYDLAQSRALCLPAPATSLCPSWPSRAVRHPRLKEQQGLCAVCCQEGRARRAWLRRECLFPGSQALVTVPPVLPAFLRAAPRPPAPSRNSQCAEPEQNLSDATMSLFLPNSPPPSLSQSSASHSPWLPSGGQWFRGVKRSSQERELLGRAPSFPPHSGALAPQILSSIPGRKKKTGTRAA